MSNIVICICAYNRIKAFSHTLNQLAETKFPENIKIDLKVYLDYASEENIRLHNEVFRHYHWDIGVKNIVINNSKKGLKNQIEYIFDDNTSSDWIVLFEDDMIISPYWYEYVTSILPKVSENDSILGVSLYSYRRSEVTYEPIHLEGNRSYTMCLPSSWGCVLNARHWKQYRLASGYEKVPLPKRIKSWDKNRSWKRQLIKYMVRDKKLFVYPSSSYVTPSGENGSNVASNKNFFVTPISNSSCFDDNDGFDLYSVTGYKMKEIQVKEERFTAEIDLYQDLSISNQAYILSPIKNKVNFSSEKTDQIYLSSLGIKLYAHENEDYFSLRKYAFLRSLSHKVRYIPRWEMLKMLFFS